MGPSSTTVHHPPPEEPQDDEEESAQLLLQLLQLSEDQIALLPEEDRNKVRELQAQLNVQ